MSKTDKTLRLKFRMNEPGFSWRETSYSENGVGPRYARWAKRYRSKRNRRSDYPVAQMSGRGWGYENIKLGAD